MTEEEKKKLREGFQKPKQDEPVESWTEDEILEAAKRIMKRLGIEEEISNPSSKRTP